MKLICYVKLGLSGSTNKMDGRRSLATVNRSVSPNATRVIRYKIIILTHCRGKEPQTLTSVSPSTCHPYWISVDLNVHFRRDPNEIQFPHGGCCRKPIKKKCNALKLSTSHLLTYIKPTTKFLFF